VTENVQIERAGLTDIPFEVGELDSRRERAGVLRLLGEIYPAVPPQTLAERLEAIEGSGWRCAGVWQDGELIALSGFWVQTRFYCGRYLYVDHFVVAASRRSSGVGLPLLDFLHDLAVREGCDLTCGDVFVTNERAQQFWQREGYRHVGQHFTRPASAAGVVNGGRG
jgi:GNAT superfamily N-acetyltransferase